MCWRVGGSLSVYSIVCWCVGDLRDSLLQYVLACWYSRTSIINPAACQIGKPCHISKTRPYAYQILAITSDWNIIFSIGHCGQHLAFQVHHYMHIHVIATHFTQWCIIVIYGQHDCIPTRQVGQSGKREWSLVQQTPSLSQDKDHIKERLRREIPLPNPPVILLYYLNLPYLQLGGGLTTIPAAFFCSLCGKIAGKERVAHT